MLKGGRTDEALELLMECNEAAIESSRSNGGGIAPFYTLRAARILHDRHEYARELALLIRYLAFGSDPDVEAARRRAESAPLPLSCPACGSVLTSWAAVCGECGVTLVRDHGALRTAAGAEREQVIHRVGRFGIDEQTWLAVERQDPTARLGDLYVRAVEIALRRERASGSWPKEREILFDLANFQAQNGEPWLETSARADDIYCDGIVRHYDPDTEFLISGCTCVPCQSGPLRMTAGEYLETRPVPHPECERPPCRCAGHRPVM
ncbi:hypothetical protein ACRAWC_01610 [Leifsonia sp. L25]|uniref:hypothetical protein n=1 Tax=Actinomycetes TaxID=1760 RepID=UPI003D68B2DE